MLAFTSHVGSIGTEGCLMNKRCALIRQLNGSFRELCVQAIHHGFAMPCRPQYHVRRDSAAVGKSDGFTVLKLAVERPPRDLEFLSPFQVENAGLVFFLKSPTQAENRVIQRKRVDIELVFIKDASAISAWEFLNVQIESKLQV